MDYIGIREGRGLGPPAPASSQRVIGSNHLVSRFAQHPNDGTWTQEGSQALLGTRRVDRLARAE